MKLYFFEIKSKEWQEIEIDKIMEQSLKSGIRDFQQKFGVKIKVEGINNAEEFVKNYYLMNDYKVAIANWHSSVLDPFDKEKRKEILDLLKKFEPDEEKVKKDLKSGNGIPDFLVWKGDEIFFVEAKSWHDGVKGNQLVWMFSHNYPVKVFVQKSESDFINKELNVKESKIETDDDYEDLRLD